MVAPAARILILGQCENRDCASVKTKCDIII
nr:MAG TPA: hypothetical protein [Caudoviricetes sp.]